MDDKTLKNMWKSIDYLIDNPGYSGITIEGFLSGKSNSISKKIRETINSDLVFKSISGLFLLTDIFLYSEVQPVISNICLAGLLLLIPLIFFEVSVLKNLTIISNNAKSVADKLSEMLSFLKRKSLVIQLSISTSYIFGFTGGMLIYFFIAYGELRRMGSMDIFVFPSICLFGIILNYIVTRNKLKYQIKHLNICLSDMDEETLKLVDHRIESKQKTDLFIIMGVAAVVFLAFLLFVFALKNMGF